MISMVLLVTQPLSHRQGVLQAKTPNQPLHPARNSVLLCWRVGRAPVNGIPLGSDVKTKGRNHLRHSLKINDFSISKEYGHEHDADAQRKELLGGHEVVQLKRGDAHETLFYGGRLLNGPAYRVA